MPRVARTRQPDKTSTAQVKLKQCLGALVTDPEAACLGGNELCCVGCGGNSYLVDSLCAFCLHSDAARKCFVANGGLDALLLAAQKKQVEKTALAALTILQCLCTTRLGQQLVVTRQPDLLQLVCDYALLTDEDSEGVQLAALTILTDWMSDGSESQLVDWLLTHPTMEQPEPARGGAGTARSAQQPVVVFGQAPGASPATRKTLRSTSADPVVLRIASTALLHQTLAVRKAGAQLFTAIVSNPSLTQAIPAAVTQLNQLTSEVQQLLRTERESIGVPQFAAFANGRSSLLLDPMAFLVHQERMAHQKHLCHALLHLACELGAAPACGTVLSQVPGLILALLDVFESAWQDHQSRELALDALAALLKQPGTLATLGRALPTPTITPATPTTTALSTPPSEQPATAAAAQTAGTAQQPTAPAPTASAAGQGRAVGLGQVGSLQGPGVVTQGTGAGVGEGVLGANTGAPSASVGLSSGMSLGGPQTAAAGGVWSDEAAEERALGALMQLVHRLLKQQSAGHVRAAMVLLGHTRFDQAPQGREGVHVRWLRGLCDLFDVTWRSEVAEVQRVVQADQQTATATAAAASTAAAAAASQPAPPTTTAPTQPQTASDGQEPSAAAGVGAGAAVAAVPQPAGPLGVGNVGLGLTGGGLSESVSETAQESEGELTAFMFDVGLGYRVLVQVLQSWRSLLDLRSPCVLSLLTATGYAERVQLATTHPRPAVAQAAWKILSRGDPSQDQANNTQSRPGVDSSAGDNWNAWIGLASADTRQTTPPQGLYSHTADLDPLNTVGPDPVSVGSHGAGPVSTQNSAGVDLGDAMDASTALLVGGLPLPVPMQTSDATDMGFLASDDQEMQEFLSVFLDGGGADGPTPANPPTESDMLLGSLPAIVELPTHTTPPTTQQTPATNPYAQNLPYPPPQEPTTTTQPGPGLTSQGNASQQGQSIANGGENGLAVSADSVDQGGLFSAWDAMEEEEDAVLQEALMLLPDLDNVARNMTVPGGYDARGMMGRMAGPMALLSM